MLIVRLDIDSAHAYTFKPWLKHIRDGLNDTAL